MSEVKLPAAARPEVTPLQLLSAAVERGMDPDQLDKLLALHERWESLRAAERYAEALAAFQREMPPVVKRNEVKNRDGGAVRYRFASFEDIMLAAGPVLARHGITVTFSQTCADGMLKTVVRVRVGSHFEDKPLEFPIPDVPRIAADIRGSEPQAVGVVVSYCKRYALCNALNIVVVGEDLDAQAKALPQTLTDAEAEEVKTLLARKKIDEKKFLAWAGAGSVEEINRRKFAEAVRVLKSKPDAGG